MPRVGLWSVDRGLISHRSTRRPPSARSAGIVSDSAAGTNREPRRTPVLSMRAAEMDQLVLDRAQRHVDLDRRILLQPQSAICVSLLRNIRILEEVTGQHGDDAFLQA